MNVVAEYIEKQKKQNEYENYGKCIGLTIGWCLNITMRPLVIWLLWTYVLVPWFGISPAAFWQVWLVYIVYKLVR